MEKEANESLGAFNDISASFEGDETRVSLEQVGDLSLVSKWDFDEKFDLFVNNQEIQRSIPVGTVSEDRKRCSFSVDLSKVEDSGQSRLLCATSPANATIRDGQLYCNASIVRSPLPKFDAPLVASTDIKDWESISLLFKHYLTYEIVHINNDSDHDIRFSLCGYEPNDNLWFYPKGAVAIDNGTFRIDTDATGVPMSKSEAIVVGSRMSDVIVSAYRVNGKKISSVSMITEIDGQTVHSSNTLSSDIELQSAHAYHIYVVWDGTSLFFVKGGSEVDAGGSGYGTDGSGNISGQGLGYGTDSSGNITGNGSGYGADGSGSLSGGGSGYSNGN